jgi:hypothetical protein
MKTIALICCGLLIGAGTYFCIIERNIAGLIPLIVGSISCLIITRDTEKIPDYNPDHFMNK